MVLGVATIVCIVAFVICAFLVRWQLHALSVVYETRMKTLHAAEIAMLGAHGRPDFSEIERHIENAAESSAVLRKHAVLFRLLWPHEYERAFYAGERFIAQASRIAALGSRPA